jgi:hypothetical protein
MASSQSAADTTRRHGAALFPSIDTCQVGIFKELRIRELRAIRAREHNDDVSANRHMYLFRQHLNAVYH